MCMKYFFLIFIYLAASFLSLSLQAQDYTFTDERDGRVYRYVTIGDQTWMAENLAYLPQINRVEDAQFETERFWVYGYRGTDVKEARQTEAYRIYGVLYNWTGACNSCPKGWHLPTDEEWRKLEMTLGMTSSEAKERLWRRSGEAGKKLMSKDGWKKQYGTNESGFNALPAGIRGLNGFEAAGYGAYFWTASPTNGDNGLRRGLLFDDAGINRTEERRYIGHSVRCVKDKK